MKKLSEFRGEDAILLLADLIEPIADIASDKEMMEKIRAKKPAVSWIGDAIRNHKDAFLRIASVLSGEDAENISVLTLPCVIFSVASDADFMQLFISAARTVAVTSSASQYASAPNAI